MPAILPRLRAPEFAPGAWINTPHPLRMSELRRRVVLVDIWDFT